MEAGMILLRKTNKKRSLTLMFKIMEIASILVGINITPHTNWLFVPGNFKHINVLPSKKGRREP